jgi:hypothetical protein
MARKERKYHYIYKITCLKNERYYIGMHSTDNLEDGYFGGGKRIKNSVKKHGKDAHRKEILEFFENRELLVDKEIELINEELLKDPLCMNLNLGGEGDIRWARESRSQGAISANKKNWKDKEFIKKIKDSSSKTFKRLWEDTYYREIFINACKNSFKGKSHTEESKKKIGEANSIHQKGEGNSQYGKIWIYNDDLKINKKVNPEELENLINIGFKRGMRMEYFKK